MNSIKKILLHPGFIALLIAVLMIWALPPFFSKFTIELKSVNHFSQENELFLFDDLNNDGVSDIIRFGFHSNNLAYFDIRSLDGYTLDNWVVEKGTWTGDKDAIITGDYDDNGMKEVYGFAVCDDSVFLTGIEPFGSKKFVVNNRFIIKGSTYHGVFDTHIGSSDLCDLNGDGYKEVVASFVSGYSIYPRLVVAYDIKNDTVFQTKNAPVILEHINCGDIDNDSVPEIIGKVAVRGNTSLSEPMTDSLGWFIVYDNHLNFKFPPVAFFEYPGGAHIRKCNKENGKIVVLANYTGVDSLNSFLYCCDAKTGRVNDSAFLKKGKYSLINIETKKYDKLFLEDLSNDDVVFYTVNKDLGLKKVFQNKKMFLIEQNLDINCDGYPEFLFRAKGNSVNEVDRFIITDHNFKNPVSFATDKCYYNNTLISTGFNKKQNKYYLGISTKDKSFVYEYIKNPLYYFKYPIYLAIYFVLFAFFALLLKFQKQSIEKNHLQEKQLLSLQLKTIKNQLDPHFALNTLNAIGALIAKKDTIEANKLFERYLNLTKQTLLGGGKISSTLREELKFVRNYLEIEKFRYGNKFEYSIEIAGEINPDNVVLPRMLIHTFAENAVKHGLRHLTSRKGMLTITATQQDGKTVITVSDDGIGREEAGKHKQFSTGKGLNIAREMVLLYNKLNNTKIRFKFFDLEEGTKVKIWV